MTNRVQYLEMEDKSLQHYETMINGLAEIEAKSFNLVRDGDPEFASGLWEADVKAFLDATTLKGLFFSEDWVFITVDLVASKISAQPLNVYRKELVNGKMRVSPAEGHPLQTLFAKPNQFQDYHSWMYSLVVDLTLLGNSIQWKGNNQIIQLPAESIALDFDKGGKLTGYIAGGYTADGDIIQQGKAAKFLAEDVLHMRRPNPASVHWGLSPFTAGRKSILFSRYTTEYLNNFYHKGATPGLALEMSEEANEKVALRMLRSFEMLYTGRRNQRRTLVMPKGVSVKPISPSLADQQLVQYIDKNRETIIALLKVPKHELSLQTVGSMGSEEYKQALKNFWAATLKPTMAIIAGTLTDKYRDQLGKDFFLDFDLSNVDILQEDQDKKAQLAEKMLKTHTLNEVRAKVYEIDPLPGGDQLPGYTPPQFGGFGKSIEPEAKQIVQAEVPQIENSKAMRANTFIKSNSWFNEREKIIKEATEKGIEALSKTTVTMFIDMGKAIIKAVKEHLGEKSIPNRAKLKKSIQKQIEKHEEKWVGNYVEILEPQVEAGHQSVLSVPFNQTSRAELETIGARNAAKRRDILEERGLDTFANMSKTTTDRVLDIVEAGINEKKTVQDIAKDIFARIDEVETISRALTIARTETLTAVSIGQAAAVKEAKTIIPNLKKMWITADDDRVRDSHKPLHGDIVGVDEPFSNGLQFPRDPSGEASEVIQCRCSWIALPSDQIYGIDSDQADSIQQWESQQ